VSSTTTLIFCPPFTAVTAFVVVPGFASTPPQGASFCGSPLSSSTSHEAGSSSLKCALTIGATVAPSTATDNPRTHFFTMTPKERCADGGHSSGPQTPASSRFSGAPARWASRLLYACAPAQSRGDGEPLHDLENDQTPPPGRARRHRRPDDAATRAGGRDRAGGSLPVPESPRAAGVCTAQSRFAFRSASAPRLRDRDVHSHG